MSIKNLLTPQKKAFLQLNVEDISVEGSTDLGDLEISGVVEGSIQTHTTSFWSPTITSTNPTPITNISTKSLKINNICYVSVSGSGTFTNATQVLMSIARTDLPFPKTSAFSIMDTAIGSGSYYKDNDSLIFIPLLCNSFPSDDTIKISSGPSTSANVTTNFSFSFMYTTD